MDVVIDPAAWGRGLAGGVLIGLAAALLMLANGRVAGISGIAAGVLIDRVRSELPWRLAFLLGLVAGGGLVLYAIGARPTPVAGGVAMTLLAGLLVGLGTRLGHGCTSGHGVCGLARLSPRSLVATLSFMGCGFATVALLRIGGWL